MSAGDRDWAITGVSLRSGEVAHQMNHQEGLYTVTERAGEGASTRIIGAVKDVLVAPYEPEAVAAALAAPATCEQPSADIRPPAFSRPCSPSGSMKIANGAGSGVPSSDQTHDAG